MDPSIANDLDPDMDDAVDELGPGGIPFYRPNLDDGIPRDHTPRTSFAKSQFLLNATIDNLIRKHPVTHVIFVTLTFPNKILNPGVAQKKLNSLFNALRKRYGCYVWVLGWHASTGIHYHLLIPVPFDCHTGSDLSAWSSPLGTTTAAIDREQRNAMNPELQAESEWWHDNAPGYGFGRLQVAPIHSNGEAIRKYFLTQAQPAAHALVGVRHVRFWSCSKNLRCGTMRFSWNSTRATQYRALLREWAAEHDCFSWDDLPDCFGPRWFLSFRDFLKNSERDAQASQGTSDAVRQVAGLLIPPDASPSETITMGGVTA